MHNAPHLKLGKHAVAMGAALVAAAALALAGSLVAAGLAQAADSCTLAQMSASSQPACWQPFTDGPFNTELSSSPALASDNAAVLAHMAAYNWWFGMTPSGFSLGVGGSRPVFFATDSDPTMQIVCTNANGPGSCVGANGVDVGGQTIHVPAGAEPEVGYDEHLTVIETATGDEYDFWKASIQGSTIDAGAGSVVNANTSDGLGAEGDAAGFALTGGLLRPSELASGVINHALVVTVPCTDATGANVGYSWPAAGGWGEVCGEYWDESPAGAPELGQLLRLNLTDAQIASSSAPAWEQTIMTALAHYGAYIEDTDGPANNGIDVITQDSGSWTDLGLPDQWATVAEQLGYPDGTLSSSVPIPASDLQVVSACAPEGTCPASVLAPTPPVTPTAPAPPATPTQLLTAPVSQPQPTAGASASASSAQQAKQKATPHKKKHHQRHKKKRHQRHKEHQAGVHKEHKAGRHKKKHHADQKRRTN